MLESIKNLLKPKHQITDFRTIGYTVNSAEDLMRWASFAQSHGKKIDIPNKGAYYCLRSESGAELWAQSNLNNQIMGLHPGFSGVSEIQIKAEPFINEQFTVLDGGYDCWLITDEQEYPLIFEAPNFCEIPTENNVIEYAAQVSAFAKEVSIFNDQEEMNSDSKFGSWASKSFVPIGTFPSLENDTDFTPGPIAFFTGFIKSVELRKNEITNVSFYWFLIDSLSAEYDVLVDPQLINKQPKVGQILAGKFYLSGKILK